MGIFQTPMRVNYSAKEYELIRVRRWNESSVRLFV